MLPNVNQFFTSSQTSDSAAPSLRSSNLSVLKKRWEQAGNRAQPPSVPPPSQPSSRCRPKPTPNPQGGQLTTSQDQKPLAPRKAYRGEEDGGMDRDVLTQSERPEMPEEQVPTSPRASYEKPRVPLNNLKMKFERGDDAVGKVIKDKFTGEALSITVYTPTGTDIHNNTNQLVLH